MMKSTGIVRKVDELGRVVIPIELRRTLGIGEKDALEIYVDGERIMLKKYEPACIFSGNADNLVYFRGKMISKEVLAELAEIYKTMTNEQEQYIIQKWIVNSNLFHISFALKEDSATCRTTIRAFFYVLLSL